MLSSPSGLEVWEAAGLPSEEPAVISQGPMVKVRESFLSLKCTTINFVLSIRVGNGKVQGVPILNPGTVIFLNFWN